MSQGVRTTLHQGGLMPVAEGRRPLKSILEEVKKANLAAEDKNNTTGVLLADNTFLDNRSEEF